MIIKTSSGFECEINENIKDDWRVVKALAKMKSDDNAIQMVGNTELVSLVFGAYEDALIAHVTKDGICKSDDINKELSEVFDILKGSSDTIKK